MNRILKNLVYHAPWLFSDRKFLELSFPLHLGYELNLDHPMTYNEKIQWLKLNDRKPEYRDMVDKSKAKAFAAGRIGSEHIIPTIGVYSSTEEIPWNDLPDSFVIKCTHDSGGIVICRDKAELDIKSTARTLDGYLGTSYYGSQREWVYKDIKPALICEPYMGDLKDYKWFCCDGEPEWMFIASDRGRRDTETKFDFYDCEFNHLPFVNGHPNADVPPQKPCTWEEMKELARKLSAGMKHVRVDLYEIDGKVYFGEMTFYHWSGLKPFEPSEWDLKLGEYIRL